MIKLKYAQPVLAFSDEGCAVIVFVANSTIEGPSIHMKIYFTVDGETRILNDRMKPSQFERAVQLAARKMEVAKAHPAHINGVRQLRVVTPANDNHQKKP